MKQQLVSERRSCQLIGIWRSSYRYQPVVRDDGELVTRLHGIAVEDETAGYRTAWAYLRQDGMLVNHKRVQHVWREEGLTQPIKKGRKRAKGGAVPLQATHANHVWTYDFVHDRTEDGQPLRFLTVEDEYTREGLAVAVGRSMPADRVIEVLKEVFRERGTPEYLRSDNGTELTANKLVEWLSERGVQTHPHRSWKPMAERVWRKLQRDLATGVSEPGVVLRRPGSAREDRSMAAEVQQPATSQLAGIPNAGPVPRRCPSPTAGTWSSFDASSQP